MTFGDAVSTCLSKYATFSGRARRPEFWWFFLFGTLVSIGGSIADAAAGLTWEGSSYGPISTVVGLALLVPTLAVGSRRLHDIDRSGWWQLLYLIPCLGLIALIFMLAREGQPHPNKYGEPAPRH